MKDLSYEEIEPRRVYNHTTRRTITEADNVLLSTLTLNLQPLHIDADFAAKSMWGKVLVDSMVTIGVVMGIHGLEITFGGAPASPFINEVKFPNPVFHGDTLSARSTVLGKSETSHVAGCGDVNFLLEGFTQDGVLIMSCDWVQPVRKRV
jgi:acyl dehydratase